MPPRRNEGAALADTAESLYLAKRNNELGTLMRKPNWRLAVVGIAMIALAAAFFLGMASIAGHSNDPAELMRTVGTVSGAVGGIGVVMILFGVIGRKAKA